MCDYYCSESEALAECEDDNCELYYDEWDEYSGAPWIDYPKKRSIYVGRKPKLGKKIEHRKEVTKNTVVGNKCRRAM